MSTPLCLKHDNESASVAADKLFALDICAETDIVSIAKEESSFVGQQQLSLEINLTLRIQI